MTPAVQDPIALYRDTLRGAYEHALRAHFDALLRETGVTLEANRRLLHEAEALSSDKRRAERHLRLWQGLSGLLWTLELCGLIGLALLLASAFPQLSQSLRIALCVLDGLLLVALPVLFFKRLFPRLRTSRDTLRDSFEACAEKEREIRQQVAPFHAAFTWQTPLRLITQVAPFLTFRPALTEEGQAALLRELRLPESLLSQASVTDLLCGAFEGSPFLILTMRQTQMTTQEVAGSLNLSRKETENAADGSKRAKRRQQVLVARLQKPRPEQHTIAHVLLLNDAEPALTFTRLPSAEALRAPSAEKEAAPVPVTPLDATPFEVEAIGKAFADLFHPLQCSNEEALQRFIPPQGQQHLLTLLRDHTVGFGDDFSMTKAPTYTLLTPHHLVTHPLHFGPTRYYSTDLEAMRERFILEAAATFRSLYFAIAPLLTIAPYRTLAPKAEPLLPATTGLSDWEMEAAANAAFAPQGKDDPEAPPPLVKVLQRVTTPEGLIHATFLLRSWKAHPRTEDVPTPGDDGRLHNVPVHWMEYLPEDRERQLLIQTPTSQAALAEPALRYRDLLLQPLP